MHKKYIYIFMIFLFGYFLISAAYFSTVKILSSVLPDIVVPVAGINKMQQENRRLKKKLHVMEARHKRIKSKLSKRRKGKTKRTLARIEHKIAKAPASMLPWAGDAVVVGTTTYEVNELCIDIKQAKEFEAELFNEVLSAEPQSEKICGMNVEKELMVHLEEQLGDSKQWIIDSYDDISNSSLGNLKNYYDWIFN